VYVDESKLRPFRLAATVVTAGDVALVRRTLREQLLPNQQRLHFKSERRDRRRSLLRTMTALPVEVWLYEAGTVHRNQLTARDACLAALVEDLLHTPGHVRLFIENEESVAHRDRTTLFRALSKLTPAEQVSYAHVAPKDEPGLWVSDGIAWCWPKGGIWRDLVKDVVSRVRSV
jgi:hypothetical protein